MECFKINKIFGHFISISINISQFCHPIRKNQQMKRKREPEEEEIVIEIKEKFTEINTKIKSNTTKRGIEKTKLELNSFETFVEQQFIKSVTQDKQKIFKFICTEHPTLVPPNILFYVSYITLEMVEFLFEKKLVSKETRNHIGEDALIHWIRQKNFQLVEYLISIQKFDLTITSGTRKRTGFSKKFNFQLFCVQLSVEIWKL
jgi:hypothetical protein